MTSIDTTRVRVKLSNFRRIHVLSLDPSLYQIQT